MNKEQITKILSKIKNTVGENNYKLALAITGHRTGKIKDIIMCSKDGELLLEYVEQLEQQVKKQKEAINKIQMVVIDMQTELMKLQPYHSYVIDGNKVRNFTEDFEDILKEVSDE